MTRSCLAADVPATATGMIKAAKALEICGSASGAGCDLDKTAGGIRSAVTSTFVETSSADAVDAIGLGRADAVGCALAVPGRVGAGDAPMTLVGEGALPISSGTGMVLFPVEKFVCVALVIATGCGSGGGIGVSGINAASMEASGASSFAAGFAGFASGRAFRSFGDSCLSPARVSFSTASNDG